MDIYKAPDSNNQTPQTRQLKPINAICYGLLISVALTTIVSIVEGIIFGIIVAITQGAEKLSADFIAENSLFLAIDLIVTFVCLFYAGKITGKYASGQELKFGLIVALITSAFYILIYSTMDITAAYPIWYNLASFVIIFVAILLGAKTMKQKSAD
jgi:type III secretory pathway component EscS